MTGDTKAVGMRICSLACILSVVLFACLTNGDPSVHSASSAPAAPSDAEATYRIAVVQINHETNSFSPVKTTLADFKALCLCYGDDVLEMIGRNRRLSILAGCIDAIEKKGKGDVAVVPIMMATAMSGGPLERETYGYLRDELVRGVLRAGRLDGVYIALHGAMGVDGMINPEGELLRTLREIVGPDIPVGLSLDLHANITAAYIESTTFITGYKTNPHRDFYKTGYAAGEILLATVRGDINPTTVAVKMPLLKGGGMTIDFMAPMRKIFKVMKRMERRPDVLNVSNFMVHVWLDDPELGWTVTAVTNGDSELARSVAEEIADLNWSVRDAAHPKPLSAAEAVEIARRSRLARAFGTTIMADIADSVGAGAPGENTWILQALLEHGPDLVSYIPVRDADAARIAFEAEVEDLMSLEVGGKLDVTYNRPLKFDGILVHKELTDLGKTAILKSDGVHLILTELPAMTMFPSFFTDLGLRLGKADIVVVKNIFPFRFTFSFYNRKTLDVSTPGITNIDVFQLNYEHIPRPIYPLDELGTWREHAVIYSDKGLH